MKLPTLFVGLAALWCRATGQKSYRPGGQSSGSFGSASSSVGGGSSGSSGFSSPGRPGGSFGGGSSSSGFSSGGSSSSGFGGGSFGGGSGGGSGSIEDAVPGVPGDDYPIFAEVPPTSFQCDGQIEGGYYADLDTDCQAFHICAADAEGGLTKYSFLCPNGTLFNQQYFICDWWFNVDCSLAENLYSRNAEVAAERQRFGGGSGGGSGGRGGGAYNGGAGRGPIGGGGGRVSSFGGGSSSRGSASTFSGGFVTGVRPGRPSNSGFGGSSGSSFSGGISSASSGYGSPVSSGYTRTARKTDEDPEEQLAEQILELEEDVE